MNKTIQRITSAALSASILFTLPLNVFAVDARDSFTVTLTQDSRVKYSGVSKSSFSIKSTTYKSVYAKVTKANQSQYYIEDVDVSPENAADVTYNAKTGEIFIENATNDFTITPELGEISYPSDIAVDWQFVDGGVYDEENPAATVDFNVTVTDENGEPAANTKVYYKSDESEKSYTNVITTDKNGNASVRHSYGLDEGEYEESFTALFSTDSKFSEDSITENVDFNVVLQKKSDLQLTTDQVRASRTNEGDGGVIGLDPRYEYFTGVLHQAAITTDSGEWITPENGNIDGLAPGQYALRWAERVEDNTIYLHSDYDYFTIDRAEWAVTAEETEGVTFKNDVLYAAPGGEVFYYVDVADGYKITDYSVDKPNNIDEISYNSEDGYIYIGGITGSVKLNVAAEKIQTVAPKRAAARRTVSTASTAVTAVALDDDSDDETTAVVESENQVSIAKVYFANDTTNTLYIKINPGNNEKITLKRSTSANGSKSNLSTAKNTDEENLYSIIVGTVSSAKTYYIYYQNGSEYENIGIIKINPATLNADNFSTTKTTAGKSNGTITYNENDYDAFLYKKYATSDDVTLVNGKTISGLEAGSTYSVYSAPANIEQNGINYTLRAVSKSYVNFTIEEGEAETKSYTVTFVNAAGKTVSTETYEEDTAASAVAVPANTASYEDENGNVYSYSWGEIEKVTGDATYTEIETVKKATKTEITDVSIDSNNYVNFTVRVTDNDGNPASGSVGISVNDGSYSNYTLDSDGSTVIKRTLSGGNTVNFKFYGNDNYGASVSDEKTVSVSKAETPTLEQTPDVNASGQGKITVKSDYSQLAYYKSGATTSKEVPENKVITGLTGKNNSYDSAIYYVYVVSQAVDGESDYNFVTQSEKANIEVQNIVKNEDTLTLGYDNGKGNIDYSVGQYETDQVLTVHARTIAGRQFSHWAIGSSSGTIVSTSPDYSFLFSKTTALYAVYVDENAEVTQAPAVVISNVYRSADGDNLSISFESTRSVPNEFEVVSYGVVYAFSDINESSFEIGKDGVYKASTNGTSNNGVFTLTINCTNHADDKVYVRGYVTYKNTDGGETTVYTSIEAKSYNDLT